MNYYNEIKKKLINDEVYSRVKDYSKEKHRVITYFEIGKLLNEAGGKYGDKIIEDYSRKLVKEVGKKYNKRTLFRMKQFYNIFSDKKVSTMWTQLAWSHLRLLFNLEFDSINYYIQVVINKHLSVRELDFKIKSNEYERLPEETKKKFIIEKENNIEDFIKNPIIIRNPNYLEIVKEKALQQLILEDIPSFLDELGTGFTFIRNEYKIRIGNVYNYIDLLLYNIDFNCYVVVELKVTELKKEHIGQVQVYMNYIDNNLKRYNMNKTIGLIIVKKDNRYIIEYSSDKRIISKEYILI